MSGFQQAKLALVGLLGLPKDALHIYVGLTVFLLAAWLLRRPLRSFVPIGAVLIAALAGEVWDLADTARAGRPLLWAGSWHDIWNTAFWPAMLFLLARYTRLLKR
ncbi:MAG TPA: hypothetical protein VGB65_03135 [Allosphingosinicella sp.]